MDFLDDLAKAYNEFATNVKDFADKTGQTVGKATDVVKLKSQILKSDSDLTKLYAKLGEAVYPDYAHLPSEDLTVPISTLLKEIREAKEQKAKLEADLKARQEEVKEAEVVDKDDVEAAADEVVEDAKAEEEKIVEEMKKNAPEVEKPEENPSDAK